LLDALTLENALATFMEVAPNAPMMLPVNGAEMILVVSLLTLLQLREDVMELNQFITILPLAHVLPTEIAPTVKLQMGAVGAKIQLA